MQSLILKVSYFFPLPLSLLIALPLSSNFPSCYISMHFHDCFPVCGITPERIMNFHFSSTLPLKTKQLEAELSRSRRYAIYQELPDKEEWAPGWKRVQTLLHEGPNNQEWSRNLCNNWCATQWSRHSPQAPLCHHPKSDSYMRYAFTACQCKTKDPMPMDNASHSG